MSSREQRMSEQADKDIRIPARDTMHPERSSSPLLVLSKIPALQLYSSVELWGGMIGKNSARHNATRGIMMITRKEVICSSRIIPLQIVVIQITAILTID